MALFQKKPHVSSNQPLYTLGLHKTILIAGLGNPGKEYELTRHNAGYICVDTLVDTEDELSDWINKKDLGCLVSSGMMGEAKVLVIKPTTFMNLSGKAVAAVTNFYKIPSSQILVIHDDIDVPFGKIRTRQGGGSGGHKGVKSIIRHCGEDFSRIRIGIQSDTPMETSDYVLAKFSAEEQKLLPNLKKESLSIITEYVYGNELPHDTRSFLV